MILHNIKTNHPTQKCNLKCIIELIYVEIYFIDEKIHILLLIPFQIIDKLLLSVMDADNLTRLLFKGQSIDKAAFYFRLARNIARQAYYVIIGQ